MKSAFQSVLSWAAQFQFLSSVHKNCSMEEFIAGNTKFKHMKIFICFRRPAGDFKIIPEPFYP